VYPEIKVGKGGRRPEGPKFKGMGFLGMGSKPHPHQLRCLGEHWKLPQRGPGQSPGRKRIFGDEKALKMHVAGINFVSFTEKKFAFTKSQLKSWAGGGRSSYRPWLKNSLKPIFWGFKVDQGHRCWYHWKARQQCLL